MSSARDKNCKDYKINTEYRAKSYDERIRFIVLHYTALSFQPSLEILTRGQVSAHYLVPDAPVKIEEENVIYNLVDESRRAYHAGVSSWQGRNGLNDTSIGIEIVNLGFTEIDNKRVWYPFTDYQIKL